MKQRRLRVITLQGAIEMSNRTIKYHNFGTINNWMVP